MLKHKLCLRNRELRLRNPRLRFAECNLRVKNRDLCLSNRNLPFRNRKLRFTKRNLRLRNRNSSSSTINSTHARPTQTAYNYIEWRNGITHLLVFLLRIIKISKLVNNLSSWNDSLNHMTKIIIQLSISLEINPL